MNNLFYRANKMKGLLLLCFFIMFCCVYMKISLASDIMLMNDADVLNDWFFGNGPEFPGAKGGLFVDNDVEHQRRPALRLDADFTGGGNYVQAGRNLPRENLESLSLWIKAPVGKGHITIRLIDSTDQCHQIKYRISPDGNWQQICFPVARYFEKAGTSSSIEEVIKYECWGGAKDSKWHDPAKGLYILCGKNDFSDDNKKGCIWLSGVKMRASAPKQEFIKEICIDEFMKEGELAWSFNDGREFPGAKGEVSIVRDESVEGCFALFLKGDFTEGGAYVDAGIGLNDLDLLSIKMKIKTPNVQSFNVRLIDSTGQCHQAKGIKLIPDNEWRNIELNVIDLIGSEHWGGANDGKWHSGAKSFHILLGKASSSDKKPEIMVSELKANIKRGAVVSDEFYKESFESNLSLPKGWEVNAPNGAVTIINDAAFDGTNALRVSRTDSQLNETVEIYGAVFNAKGGTWNIGGAIRSNLFSPDNSFAVRLYIDIFNDSGKRVERITLLEQTGEQNWKMFNHRIEMPVNTSKARFSMVFHKTYGFCDIDMLSAVPLIIERKEKIVDRIEIDSEAVGNMFFPEDEIKFKIEVLSRKPLPKEERAITVFFTDYWGAEQFSPQKFLLERRGLKNQKFYYSGLISVPRESIEIGKYYEVHAQMNFKDFECASEYSAFARLPEAESRKYRPEDIPFTIRSWDNRVEAYLRLASRIGHRNLGLWGGWDKNDPEKVHLPSHELCLELGNKWVTGTPCADVERNGFKNYSEENLRVGISNFLKKYANKGLAYICLGNEPPERPELISEKVRAYKIVYEAIKAFDPSIKVIATSVGANRHFFEAGFHNYCDIYDFHVYETYENVRQAIRSYKIMMNEYNAPKPIFSTELGLNSQGQTRYAVAQEMVKKITVFFAEGGENVSWFGIQYPDPEGKARGTFGDSHNTFDCKYNKYNPRLDAIMYYNMINGITVKKFTDEVQYEDGVQSFLFKDTDGEAFHVLWREGDRVDKSIPLSGVEKAHLIRIDGSSQIIVPLNGTVTLGLSSEPIILRYLTFEKKLPSKLGEPSISIENKFYTILKGGSCEFCIKGHNLKANEIKILVPPRWNANLRQDTDNKVMCKITAPEITDARAGRVIVQRISNTEVNAELVVPIAIVNPISIEIFADSRNVNNEPGLRVVLTNNGYEQKTIQWSIEIIKEWSIDKGTFQLQNSDPVKAYLKGESEGWAILEPKSVKEIKTNLVNSDHQTLYRIRANVVDEFGRRVHTERMIGGFATASFTTTPIKVDGVLDEQVWLKTESMLINENRQVFKFKPNEHQWKGIEDLSGRWYAAWDEKNLYLAVEVIDDVYRVQFADGVIWNQDGLQFLFDPVRNLIEKAGKYDYSIGKGIKGEQAWCHLSAHPSVSEGFVSEIKIAVKDLNESPGGKIYEIAIPWSRLAPFKPETGANLGMSMILNEDDGQGREGFMGWFSGVHSKQLDLVGDLILKK